MIHGNDQLTLGMALRSLHCIDGQASRELQLNKNIFSPGWVLPDFLSALREESPRFSAEVHIAAAHWADQEGAQCFYMETRRGPNLRLQEAEELGTHPAPK